MGMDLSESDMAGARGRRRAWLGLKEMLTAPSADVEADLFRRADEVRREAVGDEVHLRGLIEFSNVCRCNCLYCGLRAGNGETRRYAMSDEEILAAAEVARGLGYGTVVLQSGEDPAVDVDRLARIVRAIKDDLGRAVTLSLGELPEASYAALREAGADRYLLKHETSNPRLFGWLKPGSTLEHRLAALCVLRRLGFQIGSGCMIGLPGQSVDDLVGDLLLMQEMQVDMAGMGPFIPAPGTPLSEHPDTWPAEARVRTTYRMMALLRLICPRIMMPVTTALVTLDPDARRKGLQRGANVIMPNVGAPAYRDDYVIYPGKACVHEAPAHFHEELLALLRDIGRRPGEGPGHCAGFGTTPGGRGAV